MNNQLFLSKIKRFPERLLTTFLGSIPSIFWGIKLRSIFYKFIFKKIGKSVYIQEGAEFLSTRFIILEDRVHIFKSVRIDAGGNDNNHIYLGNGVALEQGTKITALDNTTIHINHNTYIGPNVFIAGPGNIKIGQDCLIAASSGIIANNHIFTDINQKINTQGVTRKGIVIEDNCWLGYGVKILDGVTIGEGSVIGAGSVVTKNIPPYSVAVGVPAKVIKSRKPKESPLSMASKHNHEN